MTIKLAPNSEVVWRGPSALDGTPIVAVLSGLSRRTKNPKTGTMVQLWIMPADEAPHHAVRSGADAAVCGECPRRPSVARENGMTACYVRAFQAPRSVWQATYPRGANRPRALARLRGRKLRLGAWGDPAALPVEVLEALTSAASTWTGYTHQWRRFPALRQWLMASVDSIAEAREAVDAGWRYFRASEEGAPTTSEVECPAISRGVTCAECGLCRGTTIAAKSVWIAAH